MVVNGNTEGPAYLAGPMSGHPQHNFPAFEEAAEQIRAMNIPVLSPHEFGACPVEPYPTALRRSLGLLLQCHQIIMLPGWEHSKGALVEKHIAEALSMRIRYYRDGFLSNAPDDTLFAMPTLEELGL